MEQLFVRVKDMISRISELSECFDVDFGGSYKLQIIKEKGEYRVSNAMNGWGENCYDEFANEPVTILAPLPAVEQGEVVYDGRDRENHGQHWLYFSIKGRPFGVRVQEYEYNQFPDKDPDVQKGGAE